MNFFTLLYINGWVLGYRLDSSHLGQIIEVILNLALTLLGMKIRDIENISNLI